jgi:hypothetical protein
MGYACHPQSYPQCRDLFRIAILGWFVAYFGVNGAMPTLHLRDPASMPDCVTLGSRRRIGEVTGFSRGVVAVFGIHDLGYLRLLRRPASGRAAQRGLLAEGVSGKGGLAGADPNSLTELTCVRSISQEPGGIRFEIAADAPDLAVDEPSKASGASSSCGPSAKPVRIEVALAPSEPIESDRPALVYSPR